MDSGGMSERDSRAMDFQHAQKDRELVIELKKRIAELEEENETLFSNSTNNTARWINRKIEFKAKIAELESLLQELRDSGEWYLTALQFEVDGLKLKDKVDKVLG